MNTARREAQYNTRKRNKKGVSATESETAESFLERLGRLMKSTKHGAKSGKVSDNNNKFIIVIEIIISSNTRTIEPNCSVRVLSRSGLF